MSKNITTEDYKHKYMKYKAKYTNEKQIVQLGGSIDDILEKHFDTDQFDLKILFEKKLANTIKLALIDCINDSVMDVKLVLKDGNVKISSGGKIFNWKWETIKKNLPNKMHFFAEFRNKLVDHLIARIFEFFPDCITVEKNSSIITKKQECVSIASGSSGQLANEFSDYDLTITGCSGVSHIIQIFNSVIIDVFGNTPFETFDTNLYGYSFLIPENSKTTRNNQKLWTKLNINQNPKIYRELKSTNLKISKQDIWAYRRLLSYIYDNREEIPIMLSNQTQMEWFETHDNNLSVLPIKEKSAKYLEKMRMFENLMIEFEDYKLDDSTQKTEKIENLIDSLSNMNYYGDETYFTQGSFVHVVGLTFYYDHLSNQQKVRLIKIQQLIHSMVENLSYFIHAKDDIIIAVKYLQRFYHAFNLILIKNGINNTITDESFVRFDMQMMFIKNNLRNAQPQKIQHLINNLHIHQKPTLDEYLNSKRQELYTELDIYLRHVGVLGYENLDLNILYQHTCNKTKMYYLIGMLLTLNYTVGTFSSHTDINMRYENSKFFIDV